MKHVVAFVVAMFAVSVATSAGIAYLFSTVKPSPPPEYELVWTWKRIAPNVVDINANPSANYTAYPAYRAWFNVTGDRFVFWVNMTPAMSQVDFCVFVERSEFQGGARVWPQFRLDVGCASVAVSFTGSLSAMVFESGPFMLAADYITDPNATLLTIELYESVQVLRPRV